MGRFSFICVAPLLAAQVTPATVIHPASHAAAADHSLKSKSVGLMAATSHTRARVALGSKVPPAPVENAASPGTTALKPHLERPAIQTQKRANLLTRQNQTHELADPDSDMISDIVSTVSAIKPENRVAVQAPKQASHGSTALHATVQKTVDIKILEPKRPATQDSVAPKPKVQTTQDIKTPQTTIPGAHASAAPEPRVQMTQGIKSSTPKVQATHGSITSNPAVQATHPAHEPVGPAHVAQDATDPVDTLEETLGEAEKKDAVQLNLDYGRV